VEAGEPDGAAVDAEGYVWSARWGASCVVRHAPDGRVVGRLEVPVAQPSCVAFGGADRKTLFVTSAKEGFDGDPVAGALLMYDVDVAGLAEERFAVEDKKRQAVLF
jgi:sugar lactone lactonase YvrE